VARRDDLFECAVKLGELGANHLGVKRRSTTSTAVYTFRDATTQLGFF
jgi:hypothetical protein